MDALGTHTGDFGNVTPQLTILKVLKRDVTSDEAGDEDTPYLGMRVVGTLND